MSAILSEVAVILVLVGVNGLFSLSELAIVSARRPRLQVLAGKGDRGAAAALELAGDPNRFLSTVQVGITLVSTLAGVFGGAMYGSPPGRSTSWRSTRSVRRSQSTASTSTAKASPWHSPVPASSTTSAR